MLVSSDITPLATERPAHTFNVCIKSPGGSVLLELGGEQAELLRDDLARLGYADVLVLSDEYGDVRGVEAVLRAPGRTPRTPSP